MMESLGVMNLEGFGINLEHAGLGPAGAVLVYAEDVLKGKPGNLKNLEEWKGGDLYFWTLLPSVIWRSLKPLQIQG